MALCTINNEHTRLLHSSFSREVPRDSVCYSIFTFYGTSFCKSDRLQMRILSYRNMSASPNNIPTVLAPPIQIIVDSKYNTTSTKEAIDSNSSVIIFTSPRVRHSVRGLPNELSHHQSSNFVVVHSWVARSHLPSKNQYT